MVFRKISLFGKMQRGRSPSFELFQLDMYALTTVECTRIVLQRKKCKYITYSGSLTQTLSAPDPYHRGVYTHCTAKKEM